MNAELVEVLLVGDDPGDAMLVRKSYRLGANAYITKPGDFDRFRQIVHQIDGFFLGVVRLSPHGGL